MITPRFETGRPMLLAGVREHHRIAEAATLIPAQWARFDAVGRLPGQVGGAAYGATCGVDRAAGTFEYLAGVEVDGFEDLPEGLGRMRVPPARYAVFTHEGPLSTLCDTWAEIWEQWLPASGLTPGDTPDFERYAEDFDPATSLGGIEIWFPIADA